MKTLCLNASQATTIMQVFSELLVILDTVPHKHFLFLFIENLKTR